jgi:hypothetical protein
VGANVTTGSRNQESFHLLVFGADFFLLVVFLAVGFFALLTGVAVLTTVETLFVSGLEGVVPYTQSKNLVNMLIV